MTYDHYLLPKLDQDGFLRDPESWNTLTARRLADFDGIKKLTDEHWLFIRLLRNYYFHYHVIPSLHALCHHEHIDRRHISRLFGHDYREALRLAGLPNPGEEARAYL